MNRTENVEAAQWLCENVLPLLRQIDQNVQLTIAGANPPKWLRAAPEKGVIVTGYILNPANVFDCCHIAVLPLLSGAGVKVKVLECLAAGLPVVTTEIGAEGIEASEEDGLFVVKPNVNSFVERITWLLNSTGYIEKYSSNARAWCARQVGGDKNALLAEMAIDPRRK